MQNQSTTSAPRALLSPGQKRGQLAHEILGVTLPVTVLQSGNGYYLGTHSPEEGPISRESLEYFPTAAAAAKALDTGDWTQRDHP